MNAAFIENYGKDQPLKIKTFPRPRVGPNDVLVKIHAASINPIDFKVRDGMIKFLRPSTFPLILGHDCSGEIIEIGAQVQKFKVGDQIFSRPRGERIGTFAEYIAIDENEVALKPTEISYEDAASLPLVGLTCWQALIDVAQLKRGEKVLIHAGSGGVGTFAIQLAKHLGAEVWTTTSGKNAEFVKQLGADHVINYQNEKFEDAVSDLDVVFDTLGGEALEKSFQVIKRGGFVVSISGAPDYQTGQDMNLSLWKSWVLGLVGFRINQKAKQAGAQYRFIFMKPDGKELSQISDLVSRGFIKPVIDKVYPLSNVQEAISFSESGRARGKIIVKVID